MWLKSTTVEMMLSLVLVLTGARAGLLSLAYNASVMAVPVKPTTDGKDYEVLPMYHIMVGHEVTTQCENIQFKICAHMQLLPT
jgi:hypothetical protein